MSAKLKKKTLKVQATGKKNPGKWDFIKIKTLMLQMTPSRKQKDSQWNGRTYTKEIQACEKMPNIVSH